MKRKQVRFTKDFAILLEHRRAQAAVMVVAVGDYEGGPDNRHRGSDQWVFVVSGTGQAIVAGRRTALGANTLLLIERGETHEIRNTGRMPLKALTFYTPPAYTKRGTPRWRGRG